MCTPGTRRVRYLAYGLLFVGVTVSGGCAGFFEQPDNQSTPVNFRVENAASSFVEVTITVANEETEDTESDSTESGRSSSGNTALAGEEPAGRDVPSADIPVAPAAEGEADSDTSETESPEIEFVTIGVEDPPPPKDDQYIHVKDASLVSKEVVSEGTVRVSPQAYSDGVVSCGDQITITAILGESTTANVLLEGGGTGIAGFDEGSVGTEGERLFLHTVHFECGDTLVLRIDDSGSGWIEVYESGTTPPEPTFGADSTVDPEADLLEFRVSNLTGSFVELEILDKPVSGGASDETATEEETASVDNGVKIRVPPGFLTTGVVSCGSQVILVGTIVLPSVETASDDEFNHAVLTGVGTGTANFDENSVGTEAYQRLLLESIHYECGDVIQIEFTNDGNPTGEEPTVGSANVSIVQ